MGVLGWRGFVSHSVDAWCSAPCTHFDKLKQTAGHRADPDTKHPSVRTGRCFTAVALKTQITSMRFFFSHPLERGGEDQRAHLRGFEEKSAPPICHVGWKPEQTNTLGIEFEVGRSHIIYYIFSAGLTTWLCLLWLCLIWMCAERERLQLHILLHTPTCTFSRVIQCKLL